MGWGRGGCRTSSETAMVWTRKGHIDGDGWLGWEGALLFLPLFQDSGVGNGMNHLYDYDA
jgi:hypothetical protein